ncbi:hypothetical protein J3F84DRAFT_362694 [Trichoderma pleuroticola]
MAEPSVLTMSVGEYMASTVACAHTCAYCAAAAAEEKDDETGKKKGGEVTTDMYAALTICCGA